MSTTRLSFGAVLGTVQAAATAVTSTLDAVTGGVGMLNSFVVKAADEQRIRHIADKEDFIENLVLERTEQRATSAIKMEKFAAKSPDHAKHAKAAYEIYTNLLRSPEELEKRKATSTAP
jgi:hypothetical protein